MSSIKNRINYCIRNINIPCLIIFFINLYITFFTDSIIFTGEYSKKFLYIVIKSLATVSLFFFWQGIYILYRGLKDKDEHIHRYFKNFCIYFIPMMIFLFLTWPGVWRSDEFSILQGVRNLQLTYWQHWLTDVYYIFSLCIIGFPVGIIIIQLILISGIVSFIITITYEKINSKYAWVIYIPLFFPTIISNNLYPLRLPIYSFIELLFIFLIINFYISKETIRLKQTIILGILIAILSTWRAEALYYIILAPMVLKILLRNKIGLKCIISILLISFSLGGAINYVQNSNKYSLTYSLSGILKPLGAILKSDFKSNNKEEDLKNIEKVFPLDKVLNEDYDFSGYVLTYLLTNDVEKNDKNFKDNVKQLKRTYIKLILNNFQTYLDERVNTFLLTSGFKRNVNTSCADTSAVFDENYIFGQFKDDFYNLYYLSKPINTELRTSIIRFLECRQFNDYYKTQQSFHIFFNVVPSIIILTVSAVVGAIKKEKLYFFIPILLLIKVGLVFATAPAIYFMYYLPTFICGYVVGIIFWISREKILIK